MLWFLNSRLKLLVQLFWEFEIFYCLSSADCRSMTSQQVWCIYSDRWPGRPKSESSPFFLCGEQQSLSTTNLRLNLFLTRTLCTSTSFFLPCLRVTGLSGQADASLSVQSEAGPGPRPAVPKFICPSVCQTRLLPRPLTLGSRALRWWNILMAQALQV